LPLRQWRNGSSSLMKKRRKMSWSHIYSYWTTKMIGNQGYMTRGKRLCEGWAAGSRKHNMKIRGDFVSLFLK
jgi:hypothetical protein